VTKSPELELGPAVQGAGARLQRLEGGLRPSLRRRLKEGDASRGEEASGPPISPCSGSLDPSPKKGQLAVTRPA
jgi:hypothetical protein